MQPACGHDHTAALGWPIGESMFATILVAIGANLPDAAGRTPLATCQWAAAQLDGLCGCGLRGLSRWYESVPEPASDQPLFVNGMAHLSGAADPHQLLAGLHRIEAAAGRARGAANAARVLDLDLIGMDSLCLAGPQLVLPHLRGAQRGFVLMPLCDVAPTWRHPVERMLARDLLAKVSRGGIRPLVYQRGLG